jgi:hypothetical protein
MGKFAKTANTLFAKPDLKAKLWEISWIARNRFWLAVAPIMYAVRKNGHESGDVLRREYEHEICKATTARTRYFVRGSGPHSLVTCTHIRSGVGSV